jgi:threonyl-tRNA synthetase
MEYARIIASRLEELGARVVVLGEGGVGARVRDAGRRWIPLVVVVGDREAETKTVTLRRRWEPGRQEVVTLEELVEEVKRLNTSKP